jgi:hypothetical protein
MNCCVVQALEDKERKQELQREALAREQRFLKRKLESLLLAEGQYRVRVERSISECSTCTLSTVSHSSQEGQYSCPLLTHALMTLFCLQMKWTSWATAAAGATRTTCAASGAARVILGV